ncbi:MAG: PHP domain-containing protein [bacterium]|nr:PHP domain-containing protein [bacterium]
MRNFIDLHTHSTASDGRSTPSEVIALADRLSLAAVALTDHDTTAGLAEASAAAEKFPDLHFVPGIELSAMFSSGTLHILGLGIDKNAAALSALTKNLIEARNQRNPKMIAHLQELGMDIGLDDVLAVISDSSSESPDRMVGRMHIAEALRRKGYVHSTGEAFQRFIGNGKVAYVDKERLTPREVIDPIHQSGGIAILAHPVHLTYENSAQLTLMVRQLVDSGIDGLEVIHPDHSPFQSRTYLQLARQLGLVVTGGSDYHAQAKPHVRMGRPRVPLNLLNNKRKQKFLS